MLKTKSATVDVAENPEKAGSFIGYAAIFNNVDSVGDMVQPGAFTKSLENFGVDGAGIACYWGHQMNDPMKCIGWTTSAVQDERGLKVAVDLDLENPVAAQVYRLMQKGVLNQMSFAYAVKDYEWVTTADGQEYCFLKELDIHEVSVVQVGANRETELLSVKNHVESIDRSNLPNGVAEKLEKAYEFISSAISTLASVPPANSRDEEPGSATLEEGESPNSKEHNAVKSRNLELATDVENIFNNLKENF